MKLTAKEMAKRNNWDVFLNRVLIGGDFRLLSGEVIKVAKDAAFLAALQTHRFVGTPFQKGPSIFIPTIHGESVLLTKIFKDKEFGGKEAGKAGSERQENGLINAINNSVEEHNDSIVLMTEHSCLEGVTSARKSSGVNKFGKENYADLILTINDTELMVSAKGITAPAVAGGGLQGIKHINPAIIEDALVTAHGFYAQNYHHLINTEIPKGGIPEVYVRIPDEYLLHILKGTADMGGPVDYMYIGPMDVKSEFNSGLLSVSGKLIPIDDFAKSVESLFFRIRRRRISQTLDLLRVDSHGYPSIFYEQGEGHRRVVVVKKSSIPKSAKAISDDLYIANEE